MHKGMHWKVLLLVLVLLVLVLWCRDACQGGRPGLQPWRLSTVRQAEVQQRLSRPRGFRGRKPQ
jgi:hypothetical protein